MAMTAARIRILESQQTGIAKKVYSAVPIAEAWPTRAIASELARQGKVHDLTLIEGCLNTLKKSGLIREMSTGHFQRTRPKPTVKEAPAMTATITTAVAPKAPAAEPTPIDCLVGLGSKLREASKLLLDAADEVDDIALTIEEQRSTNSEELAKLRQLQAVLKSLA